MKLFIVVHRFPTAPEGVAPGIAADEVEWTALVAAPTPQRARLAATVHEAVEILEIGAAHNPGLEGVIMRMKGVVSSYPLLRSVLGRDKQRSFS